MPATSRRWRGAVSAGFVGRRNSALNPSSCNTWVRIGTGTESKGGHQFFAEQDTWEAKALRGSGLTGGPGVHKARAASSLALSLGKQEYIEFILHSQEYYTLSRCHTSPTPEALVNAPSVLPAGEPVGSQNP